ncbi:MAG: hypothetical protein P3X23_006085 [Thermosynechococcus sp. Uc]|uniref:hypothetical protein n=1 Tax=Thermosynechococcus sp. Uc TaxID=3034853 RepID=UPI001A0C4C8B|nr:hypothetical protein [Thermosynechococcus sp. Uc]MDM7326666.1 hypothetical protein [Thermosynechococcus sp. Uc]HIK26367.1 hypothetical protein [Thermosynechococcus sp. M46_R2017_013]
MKNERLGELHTETSNIPSNSSTLPKATYLTWPWIALGGGILGICVLGGLALVIVSGLSGEPAVAPTNWQANPSSAEVPFSSSIPAGSGMEMGSDAYTPMPNYDFGGSGSDFSLGNTDGLAASIREHSNENSWWAEEWSRALGDNYPEPSHIDPDGNPGWIDHSGAFHDYNSGMSEYESTTLGGSYSGE